MLDYSGVEKTQTQRLNPLPNVNSLLKISLGLIFFTLLSTALVYAETIPVDIEGTSYDVDYTATGMTVSGVEVDLESFSLIFAVDASSTGTLDVVLDRTFFDALYDDNGVIVDDEFFILADDDYSNFIEIETTDQSRTLSVEVPAGTLDIEIIGTIFNTVPDTTDDSAAADKAAADKAAADKAAADKAAADKAAADKAAADKAAADKAAADSNTTPTQCGPGTILKDGACVLDERCGPGTILENGACVLDTTPQPTTTSVKGLGKDLMMGVIAAIAIAGVVGIILGILAKASKSND
jgi:hypothetical protein